MVTLQKQHGTLYVVATPIGNLDDISDRMRDVLSSVALIASEDTRTAKKLLSHIGTQKELISLHDFNERATMVRLLNRLQQGDDLAIISEAGTPCLSDPGQYMIQSAREAGFKVVPIPGASAIAAALSASGMSADQFLFLGFLPRQGSERQEALNEIVQATRTTVFFESPQRIRATLQDLSALLEPTRTITVARELTKMHEEIVCRTISDWLQNLPKELGEFTVVVAGVPDKKRQEKLRERYEFYKKHTSLADEEIFKIMALDFNLNEKRLRYLFDS